MHSISKATFIFLSIALLLFAGCKKDRPSPSWDVDLLSPLMIDTVFITDVLSDTLITVNPDHSVSFVFDEKLYEVNIDSLVKLPDTLFYWAFKLPQEITIPAYGTIIENFDWPLDLESVGYEGVKLQDIFIRSGNLKLEVLNGLGKDMYCEFGINSAIINETDTFSTTATVSQGQTTTQLHDFAGYHLNLTGENGDEFNLLNYYIGLYNDEEPFTVYPTDSFVVYMNFEDIVIDYAKGYFGQNIFEFGPEVYDFKLFEDLNIGGFSMQDAVVDLRIENYYGIEGFFKLMELIAINSSTSEEVYLQGEMVDSNLYIDAATQIGTGMGEVEPEIGIFDFSNSNFNDLITILPDKISYTLEVETNVSGDTNNLDNFFYYDEPIQVYMEAEVNQGVMIEDMFVENTIDWNGEGLSFNKVTGGGVYIVLQNGFPFSFDANIYLEDEDHEILDTLLYDEYITSGLLDDDFKVIQPVETRSTVGLTDELKESMSDAKYTRYELLINSANNEHVKIYDDNVMQLKIIGDFTMKIEQ